jgi:phasin family protein
MEFFTDNPALRAQLQSQLDFMNEFSTRALDMLRQVSDINLKLARQTIEASIYASREMMNGDPMQLGQTVMKQLQPTAERMRSYQQHLISVLAGAQADLTQSAETRIPEASRRATAAADDMARHASAAVNVPVTGPGNSVPNGPATSNGNGSVDAQPRAI